MKTPYRETMRQVMLLAWQLVKRNGYSISEALRTAWLNIKLKFEMLGKIVKFYYQKVDGSMREAYGTLKHDLVPETGSNRRSNDTVQVYFDSERQEWRCFKKANLIKIA